MSAGKEEAHLRMQQYVGKVCAGILGNTAVFKNDENGRKGFKKFTDKLGFMEV